MVKTYDQSSETRPDAQMRIQKSRDLLLDSLPVRLRSLNAEERQIDNFEYWHDRLVVLKQVFDEARPASMRQLWYDRRQTHQWYTLWVVVLISGVALLLGFVQVVLSALQLRIAYDGYREAQGRN
jgi:hypothetical protein